MARKQQPKKQSGKGRVRVFFAEFEGDDETIQEGLKTLSTAVGKTFQPKVIALPPTQQIGEQDQVEEDDIIVDAEIAEDADRTLFDEEPEDQTAAPRPKRKPPTMSIVKDLDLRPEGKQSLRDFYAGKNPGSQEKKVAVCVYYLHKLLELDGITSNHVFSCLKEVKARVPKDLPQIIRNAASRGGWVDSSDAKSIKITTLGENLVEHDLPEKGEA